MNREDPPSSAAVGGLAAAAESAPEGDPPHPSFVQRVGDLYLRLRGSGLTLSFLDQERIRTWQEGGHSLPVVEAALREAHAAWLASGRANRSRPFPLSRVEPHLRSRLQRQRGPAGAPSLHPPSTDLPREGYAPAPPHPGPGTADAMTNDDLLPIARPLKTLLEEVHRQLDRHGLQKEPPPPPACASCKGAGYRIVAEGAFARAEACPCERRCETCGDKGFLVEEKEGYQFSRPCPCQTLPKRIAAFNASQLPARFSNKTFENFYVEPTDPRAVADAKKALRDFALGKGPGRLGTGLIGGPGRGKTHLLAATLATLSLGRGIPCRYVEISFLFADLKAAISDPRARATVDKIDELAEVEVLAIDELGKGRGSTFEEEVLDELIGRRYNNEKPTLFATNYPMEERQGDPLGESLRSRVGERIFSRLHEMVVFLELPSKADDHRLLLRRMMR